MAFWKKSEDPWDIDPEKRKKQTTAAFWENDAPAETDPAGAQSGQAENEAPRGQSLGESIKGFFGETMDPRRNKTGRHTLIRIGIAMGCTLAQINRMLRETNEACVYPLSSWELERQYADHIAGKAPF